MENKAVAMIFAAGFGKRLKPLSDIWPKPLMELGGEPIIYYLLKTLEKAQITDVYINLHHGAEQIVKALENNNTSCRLHFSLEEEILGTAGGVRRVINKFGISSKMVLLHGDILCDLDLKSQLYINNYCTLICARDHKTDGYIGGVSINNNNQIIELGPFYKKAGNIKESGFFTGVQILSKEAVNDLGKYPGTSLVGDIYSAWLREDRDLKAHMLDLNYEDLGTKERILNANMAILDEPGRFKHLDFGKSSAGDIYIHESAFVSKKAQLTGPVWILKDAVVEDYSVVGPRVIIGQKARIKSGASLKNSVVMKGTIVEKDEHLDCAIALLDARVK